MNTPKDWKLPQFSVKEFKKRKTNYCLCVPVINEGQRIKKQLEKTKEFAKLVDILILDGGSTDESLKADFLRKVNVRALLTKLSPGRQSTQLRMGFAYALKQGYQGIITMDGNGKDGVESIPAFIKKLDEGFDYIQGSRFKKGGEAINTPPIRWWGIRFIISPILSIASGFWFTDITNGFRAYSKKLLLDSKVKPFRNVFVKYELLFYLPVRASQINMRVTEVPTVRKYPKDEIPTKITSFWAHVDFLLTVLKIAFHNYDPK